jgi:rubredoxin
MKSKQDTVCYSYGKHFYHLDDIKEHPLTGDLLIRWYCPMCKQHKDKIVRHPND